MAFKSETITVLATATPIVPSTGDTNFTLSFKAPAALWAGGSDVTTANGRPIDLGDDVNIDSVGTPLYLVAAGATPVTVLFGNV